MDMKYIITEEQLRLITEEESEGNKGDFVHLYVSTNKLLNLGRKMRPEFFPSELKYTPEGYPIPTRTSYFNYDVKFLSPNKQRVLSFGGGGVLLIPGYVSPDGKTFVTDYNDYKLMPIDKNLIEEIKSLDVTKETRSYMTNLFNSLYEKKKFDKLTLEYILKANDVPIEFLDHFKKIGNNFRIEI